MAFSQDWATLVSEMYRLNLGTTMVGQIVEAWPRISSLIESRGGDAFSGLRGRIAGYNSQITDFQNQLNTAQGDLQKLKDTEAAMAATEAAAPVVTPAPSPVPTPAPAPVIPPYIQAAVAPTIITPAAVVAPTREVVTIYAPTPAPAAAVPTPEVVSAYAPAPEARGEPGIAPTPEEAAISAVSLAGMPSWAWILMAGAAVFLLFGGKGIEGVESKKLRRVRKRRQ